MFRNMVTSLFKYDRIRTTDVKAKELRRWADHLIGLAKRGDLHARRQAMAIIREKQVVHKLFEDADKRFGKVKGGYTRIVKLGYRRGDAASLSVIELISPDTAKPKKRKKKKPAAEAAPAAAESKAAAKVTPDDTADEGTAQQSEDAAAVDAAAEVEVAEETAEASETEAEEVSTDTVAEEPDSKSAAEKADEATEASTADDAVEDASAEQEEKKI
jgi:large subunit ribosomal protein L17